MQVLVRPARHILSASNASKAVRSVPSRPIFPADMVRHQPLDVQLPGLAQVDFATALSNLQRALLSQPPHEPVSHKHAAVLVPLFEDPRTGAAQVILTERTTTLRAHGGEVSFPGGKRDEADADDVATALRESQEELGLDPATVNVLGMLRPFLSKYLLSVTPVLATIPARHAFRPNPDEVHSVFACPLEFFLSSSCHRSRDLELEPGVPYRIHFFEYRDEDGREYSIWGLTAAMLIEVARLAYRREPQFEPLPEGYRVLTADMFSGASFR